VVVVPVDTVLSVLAELVAAEPEHLEYLLLELLEPQIRAEVAVEPEARVHQTLGLQAEVLEVQE
jgi:hypothetical protein